MIEVFVKQLLNGVTIGSMYALVAIGYNLIFGVLNVLSFAQGALIMLGAYGVLFALRDLGLSYSFAIVFGIAVAMLAGLLVERVSVRPIKVRRGKDLQWGVIIATIGMVLFLEGIVFRYTSGKPESFPAPFEPHVFVLPLGVLLSSLQFSLFSILLALVAALVFLLYRTKLGLAIRAIAQSTRFAHSVGINTQRVVVITFALASALGGAVGILYSVYYGAVYVFMGSAILGLKGLLVIIIAGVGNIPGCLIAGMILGMLEVMAVGYISSAFRDFVAYGALILILLFKPSGIFGERGKVEYEV